MIRQANVNDASSIAKILVHSWQVNFKDILPDTYLNHMNPEKISVGIEKSVKVHTMYVAELDKKIVGFVGFGASRIENHDDYDAELHAIHVLPDQKGNGIGKELFTTAKNTLIEQGHKKMILAVFEDNNAKGFYEKLGGTYLGIRLVEYGGKEAKERLYGYDLN